MLSRVYFADSANHFKKALDSKPDDRDTEIYRYITERHICQSSNSANPVLSSSSLPEGFAYSMPPEEMNSDIFRSGFW